MPLDGLWNRDQQLRGMLLGTMIPPPEAQTAAEGSADATLTAPAVSKAPPPVFLSRFQQPQSSPGGSLSRTNSYAGSAPPTPIASEVTKIFTCSIHGEVLSKSANSYTTLDIER